MNSMTRLNRELDRLRAQELLLQRKEEQLRKASQRSAAAAAAAGLRVGQGQAPSAPPARHPPACHRTASPRVAAVGSTSAGRARGMGVTSPRTGGSAGRRSASPPLPPKEAFESRL